MARALAEQAQRMAARVREGLSEPPGGAGHDEPWLRSGALRDSVGVQADGLQAAVGSSDPAAVPQELGTARMPARPFLVPVAAQMGEEVARAVAAAVVAVLRGDSPDTGSARVDLCGDGPDGSEPLYGGAIAGGGAPASTSSAKAPGVGGQARPAAHRSNTDGLDPSGVRLASEPGAPANPSGTPAPGALFATAQEAAINAIESVNAKSIAENRKYTGKIKIDPLTGMYYADPPIPGTETRAALAFNRKIDQLTVGDYHTHGNYTGYDAQGNKGVGSRYYDAASQTNSDDFSPGDREGAHNVALFLGRPNYILWLGTPSGAVKQYSTVTGETTTLKPGS